MTIQQAQALNLPQGLKDTIISMLQHKDHFASRKRGKDFTGIMYSFLVSGFPDPQLKTEWIKLFGKSPQAGKAKVLGGFVKPKTEDDKSLNEFLGTDDCLGCTEEERIAKRKAQKKAKKESESNSSPPVATSQSNESSSDELDGIDDATSADDVLTFFGYGKQADELVVANMKAFAATMELEIHHAIKKPSTIAEKIFDAMQGELT